MQEIVKGFHNIRIVESNDSESVLIMIKDLEDWSEDGNQKMSCKSLNKLKNAMSKELHSEVYNGEECLKIKF